MRNSAPLHNHLRTDTKRFLYAGPLSLSHIRCRRIQEQPIAPRELLTLGGCSRPSVSPLLPSHQPCHRGKNDQSLMPLGTFSGWLAPLSTPPPPLFQYIINSRTGVFASTHQEIQNTHESHPFLTSFPSPASYEVTNPPTHHTAIPSILIFSNPSPDGPANIILNHQLEFANCPSNSRILL